MLCWVGLDNGGCGVSDSYSYTHTYVHTQINAEALLRLHHHHTNDTTTTSKLQRRLLRQMALQGWAPAMRELARAAEARGGAQEEGLLEVGVRVDVWGLNAWMIGFAVDLSIVSDSINLNPTGAGAVSPGGDAAPRQPGALRAGVAARGRRVLDHFE